MMSSFGVRGEEVEHEAADEEWGYGELEEAEGVGVVNARLSWEENCDMFGVIVLICF